MQPNIVSSFQDNWIVANQFKEVTHPVALQVLTTNMILVSWSWLWLSPFLKKHLTFEILWQTLNADTCLTLHVFYYRQIQ